MSDDGGGREVRVVDALRVPPGLERAARAAVERYRRLPEVAQVFLALAALDVLVRWIGVLGPRVTIDPGQPFATLTSFLPHDLLILLPALIVLRRPTADVDTPHLLDGAIFVALVELLSHPTTAIANELTGMVGWVTVSLLGLAIQAVGWIAIGRGLGALNPAMPKASTAGWANVAAGAILASTLGLLLTFATGPGFDLGDAQLNGIVGLHSVALILVTGVMAYVARAVLRGLDDEGRPELGLRLGAAAVLLIAGIGLAAVIVELLALGGVPLARSVTSTDAWVALRWLGAQGGTSLLVVAFALGLADPAPRAGERAGTLERA